MKIFKFVKKAFFTGLTILSILVSTAPVRCIAMNNQACKARPEIIIVNSNNPYFILVVLKQINVVAIVIILMIRMRKYVFLML